MQYIPAVASRVVSKLEGKDARGFSIAILTAVIAIIIDIVKFVQQCKNQTPTPIPNPTDLKAEAARHPVLLRMRAHRYAFLRLREFKQPTNHFGTVADTILEQVHEMDNQGLVNVMNDVPPK